VVIQFRVSTFLVVIWYDLAMVKCSLGSNTNKYQSMRTSLILIFVTMRSSYIRFSKSVHTLQELGFDYLRDNLSRNKEQLVMRWYILRLFSHFSKLWFPHVCCFSNTIDFIGQDLSTLLLWMKWIQCL